MNLAELRQKYDDLGKEIEKLEIEKIVKKLRLSVRGIYLYIDYGDDSLGYICSKGKLYILSKNWYIATYEQWRADCMPVDIDSAVEWNGGVYKLNHHCMLERIDINNGFIYDFDNCVAMGCEDRNIKRFKHNNRPILF